MTHNKLRLAIAALGDVHPMAVPHGDVHDLLEKYDNNFNGLDMAEFTVGFLRDHRLTQVKQSFGWGARAESKLQT